MSRLLLLLLLGMLAGGLLPATPAAAAPVAARDWSRVVTFTPAGTVLIGNPAARVKVVEYLSLTCPHCAHFDAEGVPPLLATYVRPGLVSFEVRSAIRDGLDLAATLIARCNGPAGWEPLSRALFAGQTEWFERGLKAPQPDPNASVVERLRAAAHAAGIEAVAAKQGLAPARAEICLASRPDIDRLAAISEEAWNKRMIPGTPAFLVNGEFAGANDWAELERAIKLAL